MKIEITMDVLQQWETDLAAQAAEIAHLERLARSNANELIRKDREIAGLRTQIAEMQAQQRVDEAMRTTQRVAFTQDGRKVER